MLKLDSLSGVTNPLTTDKFNELTEKLKKLKTPKGAAISQQFPTQLMQRLPSKRVPELPNLIKNLRLGL